MVAPKRSPNWLLYSLISVSLAAHLLFLGYISGLFDSAIPPRIELIVVRETKSPAKRNIPRPPRPLRPPEPPQHINALRRDRSTVSPVETAMGRRIEPDPIAFEAAPQCPAILPEPRAHVYTWTPPQSDADGDDNTPQDYLARVRAKIERNKKYPPTARISQEQGRAVVRFVIALDGSVVALQILKSSNHESLDQAALESIMSSSPFPKPPVKYFKSAIPIELPIIFELTRNH